MNVKVNDTVLVLTGKYKGKQGKVLAAFPKTGKVAVEGVNIVQKGKSAETRHMAQATVDLAAALGGKINDGAALKIGNQLLSQSLIDYMR